MEDDNDDSYLNCVWSVLDLANFTFLINDDSARYLESPIITEIEINGSNENTQHFASWTSPIGTISDFGMMGHSVSFVDEKCLLFSVKYTVSPILI